VEDRSDVDIFWRAVGQDYIAFKKFITCIVWILIINTPWRIA
jgi:hypothetical protein